MSTSSNCPPWCTEHSADVDQCVSAAITVSGSCGVWLLGEIPGIEPVIIVGTRPSGGELTLLEALKLGDAIDELRQAVLKNTAVRS